MRTHNLKTWPQPFAAIRDGQKRHEVRKADRDYRPGDRVVLREFHPSPSGAGGQTLENAPPSRGYTGHVITATIGYVTQPGEWGIPDGLCVFSLLDVGVSS